MARVIILDTLAYAKRLINAGMDAKQAEALAQIQAEFLLHLINERNKKLDR